MTQVHIVNRIQTDFGMVPRALWQMDLSANAKLCAAYLFCLRDGASPYVAQIERETGLGRDARRKAFSALESVGIIRWVIERDAARRIVAKSLVVDYSPVLAAFDAAKPASDASRAPEKPSDGKPVSVGTETRPCGDGISGDTLRKEKKQTRGRAAPANRKPGRSSALAAVVGPLAAVPSKVESGRRLYQGPDGNWYAKPDDPKEGAAFESWMLNGKAGLASSGEGLRKHGTG